MRWRRTATVLGFLAFVVLAIDIVVVMSVGTRSDCDANPSQTRCQEPPSPSPEQFFVAVDGSDASPGTFTEPWGTLKYAFGQLDAGDTLNIVGGTYTELVYDTWSSGNPKPIQIGPGTATGPILVQAYEGAAVLVHGAVHVAGSDYVTFDGIDVTYDGVTDESLVKIGGGTGWRWTNSEVSNSHAHAGIFVGDDDPYGTGAPDQWSIDHSYVHDTAATGALNQDHLIYVDTDPDSTETGVIERNVLAHSPNGRAIKLGNSTAGGVTVRYNTMYDNLGPSNIQVSYEATGNNVYRNIMVDPDPGSCGLHETCNVTEHQLDPTTSNVVSDNIGWGSDHVVETGNAGVVDGGGNVMLDPQFVDPATGDFHTQNPQVAAYGRYGT